MESWLCQVTSGDETAVVASNSAFLAVFGIKTACHAHTSYKTIRNRPKSSIFTWWSREVGASIATAELFLPEKLISIVESAFCSSSANWDEPFRTFYSTSRLVADDLSVVNGIKGRAERVQSCNSVYWCAPSATFLVESGEDLGVGGLLPFGRGRKNYRAIENIFLAF